MKPSLAVAALFHDPPWKPWIVTRKLRVCSGTVRDRIEEELARRVSEKLGVELNRENLTNIRSAAEKLDAHELHALVALEVLRSYLENKNHIKAAKTLSDAFKIIMGEDGNREDLHEADSLASNIDRLLIYRALLSKGMHRRVMTSFKFVNSSAPTHKLSYKILQSGKEYSLCIEQPVNWLVALARVLEVILATAKSRPAKEHAGLEEDWLLVHTLYLLMEPLWYIVTATSKDPRTGSTRLLVPPADTRIPLHTIFDHNNAVLAVLNLLSDGCLVVVDLAGVQEWISESRRLRDLWAASWLTSFLAWKTVEPFVLEYGPGVLVLPPGRLHPFYSARILGWLLEDPGLTQKVTEALKSVRKGSILASLDDSWLFKALGIPPEDRWPTRATVPSRYTIALPGAACDALRDRVIENYKDAWRKLTSMTLNTAFKKRAEAVMPLSTLGPETLAQLEDIVSGIEPPLPIRVYSVKYEPGEDDISKAVSYHKSLLLLASKERKILIRSSGRRTGANYLKLSRLLQEKTGGSTHLCTVCGKSPAIAEQGDERLCPYCLTKRLLRATLEGSGAETRELVGMYSSSLPRWDSTDEFTTRLRIAKSHIGVEKILGRICERVASLSEIVGEETIGYIAMGIKAVPLPGCEGKNSEVVSYAMSIVYQILTAPQAASRLYRERLERLKESLSISSKEEEAIRGLIEDALSIASSLGEVPRRYAIIRSDADKMGSGLLSGILPRRSVIQHEGSDPLDPETYFNSIFNKLEDEDLKKVLENEGIQLIKKAIEQVESEARRLGIVEEQGREGPIHITTYVYPSYHMTISRSLAIMSFLDYESISEAGGQLIYSGGDDVLAIAPPAAVVKGPDGALTLSFTALEIARRLRANWWGMHGVPGYEGTEGFIAITAKAKGNSIILHVASAPAAYGRSTSLYLADTLAPMWTALSVSSELEEAKDGFKIVKTGKLVIWEKDMLALGSDSRGTALLSQLPPGYTKDKKVEEVEPIKIIENLLNLVYNKKFLSFRLFYAVPEYLAMAERALQSIGTEEDATALIKYALGRHSEFSKIENKMIESLLTKESGFNSIADMLSTTQCLQRQQLAVLSGYYANGLVAILKDRNCPISERGIQPIGSLLSWLFAAANIYSSALPSPKSRLLTSLLASKHGEEEKAS